MDIPERHFNEAIESPVPWMSTAEALMQAARKLDWKDIDITDQLHGQFWVYRFLVGLAIENLLKGVLVTHGCNVSNNDRNRISKKFATHKLAKLAKDSHAEQLDLTPSEFKVLEDIEPFIVWAGRYPIALSISEQFVKTHATYERSAEIELYERIRAHLVEHGWYFDFDGNKIPLKNT